LLNCRISPKKESGSNSSHTKSLFISIVSRLRGYRGIAAMPSYSNKHSVRVFTSANVGVANPGKGARLQLRRDAPAGGSKAVAEVACRAVARSFVVSAESPCAVDRVYSAFGNENYWQARLTAFDTGNPRLDSLTTDADGTTTVTMTLSFGGDQLPGPLRRIHAGVLRVIHTETWSALDGESMRGEITVDARGMPLSGRGDMAVTSAALGSRLTGTATVNVDVPFIGGAIAKLIADPLADGILDIHDFTNSWMAEHG
jgi:hypothetical protein